MTTLQQHQSLISLAYRFQSTRNIFDSFDYIDKFKAGLVTNQETINYIMRVKGS